jgi:hypothetical protein
MKILKTMPVLLLAAFMTTSCGKENSSGGGSSSGSVSGVVTTSGTVFGDIEQVKSKFQALSFSSGVSQGTEIIHAGSRYASNSNNGSTSIFGIIDINWNTNSGSNLRALKVNTSSQDSISAFRATGIDNYGVFNYGTTAETISRSNSNDYKEMLMLDAQCTETRVSEVTISTRDTSGTNGTILGSEILCLRNGYPVRLSIVSDALPVAANPVYIEDNQGRIGYLAKVGNKSITGIQ